MDLPLSYTPLSLAEPGHWQRRSSWESCAYFNQANHNILLAEGNPYGSYLSATPYDLGLQEYPPPNVLTPGMAPYSTMPYDPCLQAYAPANVLTPGLAPYTALFEMEAPFAQGHAFATTMPSPLPYSASTNNRHPENSSNSSTVGRDHACKPRSVCITCGRDFSRASDMQRHAKKHGASKYFQCHVAGCKYAGSYRKDKLDQHVKNMH